MAVRSASRYFTLAELAEYLSESEGWIRRQVFEQKIPYSKHGKYLRFPRAAIELWEEDRTFIPDEATG